MIVRTLIVCTLLFSLSFWGFPAQGAVFKMRFSQPAQRSLTDHYVGMARHDAFLSLFSDNGHLRSCPRILLAADSPTESGDSKKRLSDLENAIKISSLPDRIHYRERETRKYEFPFEVKHAWIIPTDNISRADKLVVLSISGKTVEAEVGATGQGTGSVSFMVWAIGF